MLVPSGIGVFNWVVVEVPALVNVVRSLSTDIDTIVEPVNGPGLTPPSVA
jgi:hypothetical protein